MILLTAFAIFTLALGIFYWVTYKPYQLKNSAVDVFYMNDSNEGKWMSSIAILGSYLFILRKGEYYEELIFITGAILIHIPLHFLFKVKKFKQEAVVLLILQLAFGLAIALTPNRLQNQNKLP